MEKITEDYCSYEVAKLLKEKGFPFMCMVGSVMVNKQGKIMVRSTYAPITMNKNEEDVPCVPQSLAMKWLREKDIDIVIMPLFKFKGGRIYCYEVHSETADLRTGQFDTYEEAVEAALKYSLENLI